MKKAAEGKKQRGFGRVDWRAFFGGGGVIVQNGPRKKNLTKKRGGKKQGSKDDSKTDSGKRRKKGFTLIEVMLVVSLTGLLMVGIMQGTMTNVHYHRYNDAVQGVVSYLQEIYSDVQNPQSSNGTSGGNTDEALYGMVIVFGGVSAGSDGTLTTERRIHAYGIVGKVVGADYNFSGSTLSALADSRIAAEIAEWNPNPSAVGAVGPYVLKNKGILSSYLPTWDSTIERATAATSESNRHSPYTGVVVIVRSPVTNQVETYMAQNNENLHFQSLGTLSVYNNTSNFINRVYSTSVKEMGGDGWSGSYAGKQIARTLQQLLQNNSGDKLASASSLKTGTVDLCINSDDVWAAGGQRRDIRINANGAESSNAGAIQLIDVDSSDNKCRI